MIDINLLREEPKLFKASEKKRNRNPQVVDEILELDEKWKKELKKVEELKHQRNVVSEQINQEKKAGKSALAKIKEMREVVEEIKKRDEQAIFHLQQRDQLLTQIGNLMHPDVPAGKDDTQNVEIKKVGKIPTFTFPLKTHVELAESLGIADFEAAARVS